MSAARKPMTARPVGELDPEWAKAVDSAQAKGLCPECGRPGIEHSHTAAAIAELSITGICGECWDEMFKDDDESDSQYCECDNEPDEEELASLRCKCCGKEIAP